MWRNKNGESDWQHSFGSEELTTSTYVREIVENATFDMDTTEQTWRWAKSGRPDYLQKLKVPEGYEKMIDYSNIWHGTADRFSALSKPNFASKYPFESS